jgi:hypothetical protein
LICLIKFQSLWVIIAKLWTRTSNRVGRPLIRSYRLSRFLSARSIISLASIHPSLPRDALAGELKEAAAGSSVASSAPDQRRLRRRRWPQGALSRASRPGCCPTRLPHFSSPKPPVHRRHASLRGRPADAQSHIPHAAATCGGGRSCSRAPVELCDEAGGVEPPPPPPDGATASQGGAVGRGGRYQEAAAPPIVPHLSESRSVKHRIFSRIK